MHTHRFRLGKTHSHYTLTCSQHTLEHTHTLIHIVTPTLSHIHTETYIFTHSCTLTPHKLALMYSHTFTLGYFLMLSHVHAH